MPIYNIRLITIPEPYRLSIGYFHSFCIISLYIKVLCPVSLILPIPDMSWLQQWTWEIWTVPRWLWLQKVAYLWEVPDPRLQMQQESWFQLPAAIKSPARCAWRPHSLLEVDLCKPTGFEVPWQQGPQKQPSPERQRGKQRSQRKPWPEATAGTNQFCQRHPFCHRSAQWWGNKWRYLCFCCYRPHWCSQQPEPNTKAGSKQKSNGCQRERWQPQQPGQQRVQRNPGTSAFR